MFLKTEFQELLRPILSVVPAEKIFVLATTTCQWQTESIFFEKLSKKERHNSFYLLVLIGRDQHCNYTIVQDQIKTICETEYPVTVLAMEMEMFNDWLKEGHPFAVSVKLNALIIYDKKIFPFSIPTVIDSNRVISEKKLLYKNGIKKMDEHIKNEQFQEAAICGLMTILKATIGIEVGTNDLDKLIGYCSMVIKEMPVIFPGTGYNNLYKHYISGLKQMSDKIRALLKLLLKSE